MAATATLISTAETHVNVASSAEAVGGPNGTFAVATLPTGSSASVTTSGYGAQAAIGAPPSSIDSVAVTVHWYTTDATGQTVTAQLVSGGTPFGTAQTLERWHGVARLFGLDLGGVEFEARLIGNGQTHHG